MNNVRKVQMTQMEILRLFMDICERHRLRWYMIGGSLIGVLRHKGFIPWDDDVDVMFTRKNYEMFAKVVRRELREPASGISGRVWADLSWQHTGMAVQLLAIH